MDLNFIITHLSNFVDTWKGWGKIIEGVAGVKANGGLSVAIGNLLGYGSAVDASVAELVKDVAGLSSININLG